MTSSSLSSPPLLPVGFVYCVLLMGLFIVCCFFVLPIGALYYLLGLCIVYIGALYI